MRLLTQEDVPAEAAVPADASVNREDMANEAAKKAEVEDRDEVSLMMSRLKKPSTIAYSCRRGSGKNNTKLNHRSAPDIGISAKRMEKGLQHE